MPYFLILAPDHPDARDLRLAYRQQHLDYWQGKVGIVKIAGAMLYGDHPVGSSLLIEASDVAAAETLIADDPFTHSGVFDRGHHRIIMVRPAIGDWVPTA